MDLKECEILGDEVSSHWYYRSKAGAMERILSEIKIGKVLDIGAGSGFFSKKLLADTTAKELWC